MPVYFVREGSGRQRFYCVIIRMYCTAYQHKQDRKAHIYTLKTRSHIFRREKRSKIVILEVNFCPKKVHHNQQKQTIIFSKLGKISITHIKQQKLDDRVYKFVF